MEVPLLNRRLSTPRAATVVALSAVLATAVAVTPSLAGSFLTNQKAAKVYVSNKKLSTFYLKKKVAANTFVKKVEAPDVPVVGIAAGSTAYGPTTATTASYIPTAFTSFGVKDNASAVITFSGNATCTAATATADLACPIQIMVDGQSTGKVNFAPATTTSPTPVPLIHTVTQTTVLTKGGHTIAIQYVGASKVAFTLKSWNLAVQAYPVKPVEVAETGKTSG
jgi:hypothetical protein